MWLSDFDKNVIRAWSACVARGGAGTLGEVRDELAAKKVALKCDDLGKRLAMLERAGCFA